MAQLKVTLAPSSRVYKFELKLHDSQHIRLPLGAQVLTVAMQREKLCMWVLLDPSKETPLEERRFDVVGTGNPMCCKETNAAYIGTVDDDPYIWHIFEILG